MICSGEKILTLDALQMGYASGRSSKNIFNPLNAFALKGEMIALIGQNGIGKSTLLRTIAGLQKEISGEIRIKQKLIGDYERNELACTVGYISTEPVKVSNMKVYELVALGRYPHTDWTGKLGSDDHEKIAEAIERVNLEELRYRFINELSDGERQRAMIARVLAQDTEILIMDEPTAFLDIRGRFEVLSLLHNLTRNKDKTIIFSTHDLQGAISESDKVWLMSHDSFKEGAPEDLILNGSFNRLFDSSDISFSPSEGTFTFRREMRGKVTVEAEGLLRYWTEKAVERAGFALSNDHSGLVIKAVVDDDELRWYAYEGDLVTEFSSLYHLVNWLNSN